MENFDDLDLSQYGAEPLDSRQVVGDVDLSQYGLEPISKEQAQFETEKERYQRDPSKMVAAGVAGAARAATFGLSDVLGSALGMQDELQKLKEYQQSTSQLAEIGGGIGTAVFGPGALVARQAAKATASIASPLLRTAAKGAIEGATYGLGQTVSEQALGAKESAAESLIANVGMGALLGGGFEMGAHGVAAGAKTAAEKIKGIFSGKEGVAKASAKIQNKTGFGAKQMQSDLTEAEQKALANARIEVGPTEVTTTGELGPTDVTTTLRLEKPEIEKPKTIQELLDVEIPPEYLEMQQATRLEELEQLLPEAKLKPLQYHKEMFENPRMMQKIKMQWEGTPDETAQLIARYNLGMVNDGKTIIQDNLAALSKKPLKKIEEQGLDFLDELKTTYETNKNINGEFWDSLKKVRPLTQADINDLKLGMAEKSKFKQLLDLKSGKIVLKKNSMLTGITPQEYNVVKQVFDDITKATSFGDLQNIRESLRKSLNRLDPAKTEQIEVVRKALLDDMTNFAAPEVPNYQEIARDYAINEKTLDNIEKIIGGQIDDLDLLYKANPDKIVDRIMSSPNYQQIVKQYLGDDYMNQIYGSWLKRAFDNAFDERTGFLPQKFNNFLSKNQVEIERALGEPFYKKIKAANDLSWFGRRFLDNVNPSGSGIYLEKTLGNLALTTQMKTAALNFATDIKQKGVIGTLDSYLTNSIKNMQAREEAIQFWNEAVGLAEVTKDSIKKQNVMSWERLTNFASGTKSPIIAATTIAITGDTKDYDKRIDEIQDLALNPEKYAATIEKNTKGLSYIDPQLQQIIMGKSQVAVDFLMDKAPKNPFIGSMIMSPVKWKPSDAEASKFNRYVKAIDDPYSLLLDLEQGVLTPESVEAVKAVYPKTYESIKSLAVGVLGEHQQFLPFSKQLQLSLLLGQPVSTIQDIQMMQRLQAGAQASGQVEQQQQQAPAMRSKKIEGDFLKGKMGQSEQLIRSRGE